MIFGLVRLQRLNNDVFQAKFFTIFFFGICFFRQKLMSESHFVFLESTSSDMIKPNGIKSLTADL